MGYFYREILIHSHWRQEVPLSYWFAVSWGQIIFWRGASCLQTFISQNLAFDFRRNTATLSEFIGYIDLTDFRQISPKHPRNDDKRRCVGKFWFLKNLSRGVHLRNTTRIFLGAPTLKADTCTANQNIAKAWQILLIDALWMRLCNHFARAAACDTRELQ